MRCMGGQGASLFLDEVAQLPGETQA